MVATVSPAEVRIVTAGATDQGRRRPSNEDSYVILTRPLDPQGAECTLIVVADGMGGASAGELASAMAVEVVVRAFFSECDEPDLQVRLRSAVETANLEIHQKSEEDPECAGMGTTCTALVFCDGRACFAHVGDSRLYSIRAGDVERLTRDHTLLADLIERGKLTEAEARVDKRRNIVTRMVGIDRQVQVDTGRVREPLDPGDALLVCTDGLHGLVDDEEIARLTDSGDLEKVCQRLIHEANDRGGPDNITVVISRAVSAEDDTHTTPDAATVERLRRARLRTRILLALAVLALLAAVAGMIWFVVEMARRMP
jgi:PPM family protein phosphatase